MADLIQCVNFLFWPGFIADQGGFITSLKGGFISLLCKYLTKVGKELEIESFLARKRKQKDRNKEKKCPFDGV